MQWKSHRKGGWCAGALTTAAMIGLPATKEVALGMVVLVASADIGSLFPDIDHPNSKISRKHPIVAQFIKAGMMLGKWITSILLIPCFWISKRRKEELLKGFEHRGVFHTLLIIALIWWLLGFINIESDWFNFDYIRVGFCAGYLSHILMDMMTKGGVRLLYPFINYSFHWPFIRLSTGNPVHERIAQIVFIVITILILWFTRGYWGG